MSCLFTLGPSAIEPDGSCPGNKRRCGPSGRNLQPDPTAQESRHDECSSSRSSHQASDVTRLDLSLFGYSTTYALFLFVVADTDTQTRPESV